MPWFIGVDNWLDSYGMEQWKKQNSILFQQRNGYGSFLSFMATEERQWNGGNQA